jgi:hypothetical protein
VGFVVDRVALGEGFSEFFGFSLSISFHRGSSYSYIMWGINNRPVIGRSSELYETPSERFSSVLVGQAKLIKIHEHTRQTAGN